MTRLKMTGQGGPSAITLIALILFYILLISLILVFSRQIITNIPNTSPISNTLAIAIFIILPVLLLAVIVFNLVRLIGERTRKRAGARLKTRLILFFVLIALLSLTPQALLSINFIN